MQSLFQWLEQEFKKGLPTCNEKNWKRVQVFVLQNFRIKYNCFSPKQSANVSDGGGSRWERQHLPQIEASRGYSLENHKRPCKAAASVARNIIQVQRLCNLMVLFLAWQSVVHYAWGQVQSLLICQACSLRRKEHILLRFFISQLLRLWNLPLHHKYSMDSYDPCHLVKHVR